MEDEFRRLLRLWHRFFSSNPPDVRNWLAIVRRIFVADFFVVGAWQLGTTSDNHMSYAPDSEKQRGVDKFGADTMQGLCGHGLRRLESEQSLRFPRA